MKTEFFLYRSNTLLSRISFSIFIAIFTLFPPLYSQQEKENYSGSPYFELPAGHVKGTFPLLSTMGEVDIAGIMASVTVNQVYVNNSDEVIEATYVFPASTNVAIYSMKFQLGDREIIAVVQEKEAARSTYQQARDDGKTAALLEQHRPNVFQMSVANILPGDTIKVTLEYAEKIVPEEGIYRFVYPTVVGPRYSSGSPDAETEKWVQNPYTSEGESPLYNFDIKVNLNAGMPIEKASCETHVTNISWKSKQELMLTLNDAGTKQGNRDFILEYKIAADKVKEGVLLFEGKNENFFLAMIQPPERFQPEEIPAREYIFIVDVSGSMNGFPLDISKNLLTGLIGNLRPVDKFNLTLFAGTTALLSEESVPATQGNIQKAIQMMEKQRGGGGTELLPALKKAMQNNHGSDFSRSFIILTDGYVNVEKEAFDYIRQNLGNGNFFSFGIGTSVNRFLIEGIAHLGKGEAFVVTKKEDATSTVNKFQEYIRSPLITSMKIQFNGFEAYDVEPTHIPDLFASRPVMIMGKYRGEPSGSIELNGISGKGKYTRSINVKQGQASDNNKALPYLWAREMLQLHHDYRRNNFNDEELNNIVLQTGMKYNLLTDYTSFVAVDSEIRNGAGTFKSVSQPLPLPKGVSNMAVSGMHAQSYAVAYKSGRRSIREEMLVEAEEDIAWDAGNEKEVAPVVENPAYTGGWKAFERLIEENFKASQGFEEKNIFARIMVDEKGYIIKIEILKTLPPELEKEAIRVIQLSSGKWQPGTVDEVPVAMSLIIKLNI